MKSILVAWLAFGGMVVSQEPVKEVAPIDMEARRASVDTLKQHIAMKQKRLDEVISEIRSRAQKTDTAIESLVKTLSGLKDSQDSKRQIAQVKGEAIAGLKRLIDVYRRERVKTLEQLKKDGTLGADSPDDLAAFDKLVDKRAADIVELVKSMPGGEDISKYESDGDYSYDGGTTVYENSRVSEAWRQNRRDKVQTEKARREVQDALEKAIGDLESRKRSITADLAKAAASDAEKEIQGEELTRVNNLLSQRKGQLAEVRTPSAAPEESASKDEAQDMKAYFGDARSDIASDITKSLALYRQAVAERSRIASLKENLEARERWLSENDPAAKKPE